MELLLCVVAAALPALSKMEFATGVTARSSVPSARPVTANVNPYLLKPVLAIAEGVALANLAVPLVIVRAKSSFSTTPVPSFLLKIGSLNWTSIEVLLTGISPTTPVMIGKYKSFSVF